MFYFATGFRCYFCYHALFKRKTSNIRFATLEFQRNEENEYGDEIYLWYNETRKSWRLSFGSDFQARNRGAVKSPSPYYFQMFYRIGMTQLIDVRVTTCMLSCLMMNLTHMCDHRQIFIINIIIFL